MPNYRYKVCKGQKIVAVSTTLREAEQEAKRIGGHVYAIGGTRNPKDAPAESGKIPPIKWSKGFYEAHDERSRRIIVEGLVSANGIWGINNRPLYDNGESAELVLTHIPTGLHMSTGHEDDTVDELKKLAQKMPREMYEAASASEVVRTGMDWNRRVRAGEIPYRDPAADRTTAASAPDLTPEPTSDFPLRPVGVDGPYTTPQSSDVVVADKDYFVTLLAPKCLAPVAYFLKKREVYGYSPDLTRFYAQSYFDSGEESEDGYPRVHMPGLEDKYTDKGKGVGAAQYMSMPFAALDKYGQSAVFSPYDDPASKYTYRSNDAKRAWAGLYKAGLVDRQDEGAYGHETVDLYDVLEAGTSPLSNLTSIDSIDPRYAEVEGGAEGAILDVMFLRTVLLDQSTLHIDPPLLEKIMQERIVSDTDAIAPPPESWETTDFLRCTPDEVVQMAEFCAKHGGLTEQEYLQTVANVVGKNTSYPAGALDSLFARFGVKKQNPATKRRNPAAAAWLKKHTADFWESDEDTPERNPSAARKLSPKQQKKYLGSLKGAAREARAKEILHRREHRSNKPFKTDKGQATKPSKHSAAFAKKYGRAPTDTADAARLSGVSKDILDAVYARGMAAWQTGHRPGASQHAWAMARVQSFLTGGPTAKGPDADLVRKGRVKNPPATPPLHPDDRLLVADGDYVYASDDIRRHLREYLVDPDLDTTAFYPVQNRLIQERLAGAQGDATRDIYLSDIIKAAQAENIPLRNVPAWVNQPAAPARAPRTRRAAAPATTPPLHPDDRQVVASHSYVYVYDDVRLPLQNANLADQGATTDRFRPIRDQLEAQGLMTAAGDATRGIFLSDLIKAAQAIGFPLRNVPAWVNSGKAPKAPKAPKPPKAPKGPPRRTPADSAAQFPKRCVGSDYESSLGDASNIDNSLKYLATIIAPVCMQPMCIGVNTSYSVRHALYAPDKSVFYSSGYEGSEEDIRGKDYARQHMLPGVINPNADLGKGCGPAAYMAGPLVAASEKNCVGVYSYVGGRSDSAEATWENLIKHKTVDLVVDQPTTIRTSTKELAKHSAKEYGSSLRKAGIDAVLSVEPAEVEVSGAKHVYTLITLENILSKGIIVHMTPEMEAAARKVGVRTQLWVPPPSLWSSYDVSNFGTDDAFLMQCLNYCAERYAVHGNITYNDYMYAALLGLRDNPSLLPPVQWVDKALKALGLAAKGKRKKNPEDAALAEAEKRVKAFLSDPTWESYGGVKNPSRRKR